MRALAAYISFFFCFFFSSLFASKPIVLTEKEDHYEAGSFYIDLFFDSTGHISIQEINSPLFASRFKENKDFVPHIHTEGNEAYWIRFTLKDESTKKTNWLIELYDFEIDKFEIYIPDGKGGFIVKKGGDIYPFSYKEFKHKNFVYELPAPSAHAQTYYIKFQSESHIGAAAVIRSVQRFTGYATTEYYFLALFYGIALAMIVYNLFLYFTVRDSAYLYYVCYVFSIAIYILCHDGTGFEYLWPNHPS
jgi:two-component system, sensor histidine kinase LadS